MSLSRLCSLRSSFFFFNDTATTEIYTLSLHALFRSRFPRPVRPWKGWPGQGQQAARWRGSTVHVACPCSFASSRRARSEEHTSELQSQSNLVCRLLLEKKKRHEPHCHRRPISKSPAT